MIVSVQPRLETIAASPNIWYPDNNPNKQKSDVTFYTSLDIPVLRDRIFESFLPESRFPRIDRTRGSFSETNVFSKTADYFDLLFQDGRFELNLANYRLDIMNYLKNNPDAKKKLEYIFDGLAHIENLKESDRTNSLLSFLKKGKVYCSLITGYNPFPPSSPEGLLKLNEHFAQVTASPAYRKLEEIVRKTENGFDLQMTWRCSPNLEGDKVVSAAILPLNERVREFGDEFELSYFNRGSGSFYTHENPIESIISRAILLKFKRHFANAREQIKQTLSLLPQTAIYLGYLNYIEQLEKRGVKFCRPEFLPIEESRAEFQNVHHPLITGGSIGNPITYDKSSQILVITGPNRGGKTIYIKAAGLAHVSGMKGFLVASETASFSPFDGIYTHFIKPEDITKGESRFSDEMRRMQSIFEQATPASRVFLDEPCGGTTLSAGELKTREFLQVFSELGCPVFITTHMEGIARSVEEGEIPKALNKHLSFDNNNGRIKYNYKLTDGPAKMDYGAQIADSLGLGANELRQLIQRRAQREGFKIEG